jgi:sugar/nucleoside kinase (ribokinase family)
MPLADAPSDRCIGCLLGWKRGLGDTIPTNSEKSMCYDISMQYDLIAIGDVTTDCFIKLKTAEELTSHGVLELCMPFGTKLEYESATEVWGTGNSANAALCVAKLGLSAALVSSVGDDANGKKILESLQTRGVAIEYLTVHKNMKTNYYYILQHGAERTILLRHEPFPKVIPPFSEQPKWLYFSSAGDEAFQNSVGRYCADNRVKLAFQPNTDQIDFGYAALKDVYAATEIFICNKEEAQQILGSQESEIKKLLDGIRALGPKIAVITDGRNGASVQNDKGSWSVPMYPDPAPPVSRTGAGDVTASTTVAYIAKGMEPQDALLRGMINSAAGVQAIHAQLGTLTAEQIEEWYAKRPADFIATPL